MAKKKEIYETREIREWKMKEPYWLQFHFFMWINLLFHLVVINTWQSYQSRWIISGILFTTFYLLNGTYPYYSIKYITTKRDAILGDSE